MSLTLLLDLDDTLLGNEINGFVKAYFHALNQALSPHIDSSRLMHSLQTAVTAMLAKSTPQKTLEEAFDEIFYPGIGFEKSAFRPILDDFYANKFDELKPLTSLRPAAKKIIQLARERNWKVVIATNPIFPAAAIQKRLAWAGLNIGNPEWNLVTTYEIFHFCKPHPAYYAEILGALCWPEEPVIMVGNSLSDDITPTEALGLTTFWIDPDQDTNLTRSTESKSGSLDECLDWLTTLKENALPVPDFSGSAALMATLQSTPAVMDCLGRSYPLEKWNQRPQPAEWSFTEILCHLRDVDREVNLNRIKMILTEQNPFIPGVFTDPWVEERNYRSENGQAALQEFILARTELLKLLMDMDKGSWQDAARHAIFGPTTLHELVGFITTHDRSHISQACATLAEITP